MKKSIRLLKNLTEADNKKIAKNLKLPRTIINRSTGNQTYLK